MTLPLILVTNDLTSTDLRQRAHPSSCIVTKVFDNINISLCLTGREAFMAVPPLPVHGKLECLVFTIVSDTFQSQDPVLSSQEHGQ